MYQEDILSSGGSENPATANAAPTGEMAETVASIREEFEQLEADFGDLGFASSDKSVPGMRELDEAAMGTPFALTRSGESQERPLLLELADGNFPTGGDDQEFLGAIRRWFIPIANALMQRAQRIINKIVALARKYAAKIKGCIPKVVAAIRAFRSKKWGTALTEAWGAYNCIASKI